jgi:hypothetical protein
MRMSNSKPLTKHERIRRVTILCCHAMRNIAFYRAGWRGKQIRVKEQYDVAANSNFLDVAILDWCKLFADKDGKHHWKKVVQDRAGFEVGLYSHLKISKKEFKVYVRDVLKYRNKFLAHLDDERVMYPPKLRLARNAALYLYDYLRCDPVASGSIVNVELTGKRFYAALYAHALFVGVKK